MVGSSWDAEKAVSLAESYPVRNAVSVILSATKDFCYGGISNLIVLSYAESVLRTNYEYAAVVQEHYKTNGAYFYILFDVYQDYCKQLKYMLSQRGVGTSRCADSLVAAVVELLTDNLALLLSQAETVSAVENKKWALYKHDNITRHYVNSAYLKDSIQKQIKYLIQDLWNLAPDEVIKYLKVYKPKDFKE
jgi:hypothetical protein